MLVANALGYVQAYPSQIMGTIRPDDKPAGCLDPNIRFVRGRSSTVNRTIWRSRFYACLYLLPDALGVVG